MARDLCRGAGRLCQALAVTGALDGWRLDAAPFVLLGRTEESVGVAGRRIGLSRGVDVAWRFALAGSQLVSRPI